MTRTVDVDGDNLGEGEAIGANEAGDLAKGLNSAVLSAGGSVRLGSSVDNLKLQVVVLGSDQDREGATVVLMNVLAAKTSKLAENNHIRADRRAFRRPF